MFLTKVIRGFLVFFLNWNTNIAIFGLQLLLFKILVFELHNFLMKGNKAKYVCYSFLLATKEERSINGQNRKWGHLISIKENYVADPCDITCQFQLDVKHKKLICLSSMPNLPAYPTLKIFKHIIS